MSTLARIGGAIAETPLPDGVAERLGLHLLDILGAQIGGAATSEGQALRRLADGPRGLPAAGLGLLDRLALGVATTRLSEIDDIHLPSCTTPGSIIVPTALAIAADIAPVPAARFARALSAGYGVMCWAGTAVNGPAILYRGIWPTYLLAPLGAAAVAAVLLDLGPAAATDALALACSRISGGAGAPRSSAVRWWLAGEAARSGVSAAFAAAAGFGGDAGLLDGSWLQEVHGVAADRQALATDLPSDGANAALSLKPICAAKQTQAAMEAFRQLLAGGIAPDGIARVEVAVPAAYAGMIGHARTATRTDRMTGVAHLMGLAAYRPDLLTELERGPAPDARIAAFASRVSTSVDPALQSHYPTRWPARVTVETVSGESATLTVLDAPGDPGNPLGIAGVRTKFHRLTAGLRDAAVLDRLEASALRATTDDAALANLIRDLASR